MPKCPVKGHEHPLRLLRELERPDGQRAKVYECPSKGYRWMHVLSTDSWVRMTKAR